MASDAAEAAMAEKIERLERANATLQEELQRARSESLNAMLGPLRLKEIVLVYLGDESRGQITERMAKEYGSAVATETTRHLFVLGASPLSEEQRQAVRSAANHGMNRW